MSDDASGFLAGLVVGIVIALLTFALTHAVTDNKWRNDVIGRGLAEYQVDNKGTVSFHWLPNTNQ